MLGCRWGDVGWGRGRPALPWMPAPYRGTGHAFAGMEAEGEGRRRGLFLVRVPRPCAPLDSCLRRNDGESGGGRRLWFVEGAPRPAPGYRLSPVWRRGCRGKARVVPGEGAPPLDTGFRRYGGEGCRGKARLFWERVPRPSAPLDSCLRRNDGWKGRNDGEGAGGGDGRGWVCRGSCLRRNDGGGCRGKVRGVGGGGATPCPWIPASAGMEAKGEGEG